MLLPFCQWCESMWLGNAIRDSLWLFPVIEAVHLLGLCVLGGTIIVVQFTQPVTEEQVRNAVDPLPGDESVQTYGAPGENRILIRLPQARDVEQERVQIIPDGSIMSC